MDTEIEERVVQVTDAVECLANLRYYTGPDGNVEDTIRQSRNPASYYPDVAELIDSRKPRIISTLRNFCQGYTADDLQVAMRLAQEVIMATPLVDFDRDIKIHDWVVMMLAKATMQTSLHKKNEELDEIINAAKKEGAVIRKIVEAPQLSVGIKIYPFRQSFGPQRVPTVERVGDSIGIRIIEDDELFGFSPAVQDWLHPSLSLLYHAIQRWLQTNSVADIGEVIRLQEVVLSQGSVERVESLIMLGNWYGFRFERSDSLSDLEKAIRITREALDEAANEFVGDLSPLAGAFGSLQGWLGRRYERFREKSDLEEAVGAAEMSLHFTREDDPDRCHIVQDLGLRLHQLSELNNSSEDLDEAIRCLKAVPNRSDEEFDGPRAIGLTNLGNALTARFKQANKPEDLEDAIDALQEATEIVPLDRPKIQAACLNNLSIARAERHEQCGKEDDLDAAIDLVRRAVSSTAEDDPTLIDRLCNLGLWLERRGRIRGSLQDLEHSVKAIQIATQGIGDDHPSRPRLLMGLASSSGSLFCRTGRISDLEDAIKAAKTAVDSAFPDSSMRSLFLNNLGTLLVSHACQVQGATALDLLDEAIHFARQSVEATPVGHTDRASRFHNLGNALGSRFCRAGSTNVHDIDEAIHYTREAAGMLKEGHLHRAGTLFNLGTWLVDRYNITRTQEDLSEGMKYFQQAWEDINATPSVRIRSAQKLGHHLASQSKWSNANHVLGEAVKLMTSLCSQSIRHTDKQDLFAKFGGLASNAAAIALNAGEKPYQALQILEFGRGMIASLLMDLRADISDLATKHRSLADEFTKLRNSLDVDWGYDADVLENTGVLNISSWEVQTRQRRESEKRFDELLKRIQSQDGFSTFFRPPPEESLKAAAGDGAIVVVNISPYRCDAFLVQPTGIEVVILPDLKIQDVYDHAQRLSQSFSPEGFNMITLLEWLWRTIARPCLDALDLRHAVTDGNWPRIWWIPTGLLAIFPLHAAGLYRIRSVDTVLNRTMSSYALSIRTLVQGRRDRMTEPNESAADHALLVAMRTTPGLRNEGFLEFAQKEVDMLSNMCLSLNLKTIQPDPQKAEVLKSIQSCRVFHFAGHGQSDPRNPSRSTLLLKDWQSDPLSVEDFRDSRMQEKNTLLAYLSACSTGANEAVELADEGIHLISSLQLAGFRHVIGTLWEVSDKQCVVVAEVFYETLHREGMTDKAICRGLHEALLVLRDGKDKNTSVRGGYSIEPNDPEAPLSDLL